MGSDLFEWVYVDRQSIRNLTKRDPEEQLVNMKTKQNQLIGGVGAQLSFRPMTLPCSVYDNDYGVWTEWTNDKKYCEEDCERKARQIRSCTSQICSPGDDNRIISKKCRCPTLTEFGPPDEPSSKPDTDFCIINNGYGAQGYINNLYSLRWVFRSTLRISSPRWQSKVGCVFPMVIWYEFRLEQYRDGDDREDAPRFTEHQLENLSQ